MNVFFVQTMKRFLDSRNLSTEFSLAVKSSMRSFIFILWRKYLDEKICVDQARKIRANEPKSVWVVMLIVAMFSVIIDFLSCTLSSLSAPYKLDCGGSCKLATITSATPTDFSSLAFVLLPWCWKALCRLWCRLCAADSIFASLKRSKYCWPTRIYPTMCIRTLKICCQYSLLSGNVISAKWIRWIFVLFPFYVGKNEENVLIQVLMQWKFCKFCNLKFTVILYSSSLCPVRIAYLRFRTLFEIFILFTSFQLGDKSTWHSFEEVFWVNRRVFFSIFDEVFQFLLSSDRRKN